MYLSLWILIPLVLFLVGSVISGRDAEKRVAMLRGHIVDLQDKLKEHYEDENELEQRIKRLENAQEDVKDLLTRAVNRHYDSEIHDVKNVVKSLEIDINEVYRWVNR